MEESTGVLVQELPYHNITWVYDLLYYDGPVLTHFTDEDGDNILFYWVDYDEQFNRWIIFKPHPERLYKYLRRKISLKELIYDEGNNSLFIADIDDSSLYNNIRYTESKKLNPTYLPADNSFYSIKVPDVYEPFI